MKWDTGISGHHGFFFTPNFGSSLCFSATSPNQQYSSIVHLLTAFSWSFVKVHCICVVHCMHQCLAMNSLPNTMAWNAKLPVAYTFTFGIVLAVCSVAGHVWLNSQRMFPCSSLYMWRGYVATTTSPAVSLGNIVDSINFLHPFYISTCMLTLRTL